MFNEIDLFNELLVHCRKEEPRFRRFIEDLKRRRLNRDVNNQDLDNRDLDNRCEHIRPAVKGIIGVSQFAITDFFPMEEIHREICSYLTGDDIRGLRRAFRSQSERLVFPALNWRRKLGVMNRSGRLIGLELIDKPKRKALPDVMNGIESIYVGRRLF